MHFHRISLLAVLISFVCACSFAVTKEEMEKARAISAKIYLRWSNNGSDYLDAQNPSNVNDLNLRDKEKANIKAFMNISIPSDYASWDKKKLVEFWSTTAMAQPGLNQDGVRQGARNAIRSSLNKMSVTPPAAPEPQQEAEQSVDTPQKKDNELPEVVEAEAEMIEVEDSLVADSAAAYDSTFPSAKKESSSTWIYIVALALLVIAVVALVVYASKNMNKSAQSDNPSNRSADEKKSSSRRANQEVESVRERTPDNSSYSVADESNSESAARMREKFAETLAAKQEEIRMLSRQVESLASENRSLAEQNERLQFEADRLRKEKDDLLIAASPVASPLKNDSHRGDVASKDSLRMKTIYLGRVNSQGIFVRADRTLNPGYSIYVLDTTDGFTGTFRVADHKSVFDLVFSRPQEMLSGGCVAMDLTDTRGRTRIETEAAGTAIFEDNCWRVIRKARIRYI